MPENHDCRTDCCSICVAAFLDELARGPSGLRWPWRERIAKFLAALKEVK